MDFKIVENRIDELKDDMINDLRSLISIRSVAEDHEAYENSIALQKENSNKAETKGGYPFGEKVNEAMELMFSFAKREGFAYKNVDGYGGHIEFGGANSKEIMGILCHLDVVPEGDGWSKDPFGGEIEEGILYGRGAIDDKGPTMASFYAMKALKDVGLIPDKKVRIILGLDEETNWRGMEYYLAKEQAPDFGIAPDADFPVIHGEKGIIVFDLGKKFGKTIEKGIELRSITGGNAANMVADKARAVIFSDKSDVYENIKAEAVKYRETTGNDLKVKAVGKSLEVLAKGISAHGAMPHLGKNAISVLMEFLGDITFVNEDVNEFVSFYNEKISVETDGKSLGCLFEDEPSGKTILNVGKIEGDKQAIKVTINVRYPVTLTDEVIYDSLHDVMTEYNIGLIKGKNQEPIYTSLDDPIVVKLMDIYYRQTGRTQDKAKVIGGGTYARAADNIFAFGAAFPDDEEIAHQRDEYISVEHLVKITKIYAEAIYRLGNLE